MKKNLIALLLAVIMASGSIGSVPTLAAETTAEEADAVEEETVEEATEIPQEADTAESVEVIEEDPAQDAAESVEEAETTGETEAIEEAKEKGPAEIADTSAEAEEPAVDDEKVEKEDEGKDATRADAGDVIDSGTCGENVTWTLTGTDDNLTLTISGIGLMSDFSEASIPWKSERNKIKTIVVEDGITKIGSYAFYDCENLTSISIPENIKYIGEKAIGSCISLNQISIPTDAEIENGICVDCTMLNEVVFTGNGVVPCLFWEGGEGNGWMGSEVNPLKEVYFTGNPVSIKALAFMGNKDLEAIELPSSIISIGQNAFGSCEKITELSLPNSLKEIGDGAFTDCKSLTEMIIPSSVEAVGDQAFSFCSSLNTITLPITANYGKFPFASCGALKTVIFTGKGTVPSLFYTEKDGHGLTGSELARKSIETVIIEKDATRIERLAFNQFSALSTITIADTVETIDDFAFSYCGSLETIIIPEGVTTIGSRVFEKCVGLNSLWLPESVTSISSSCLLYVPSVTVYAPKDSYAYNYAMQQHLPVIDANNQRAANLVISLINDISEVPTQEEIEDVDNAFIAYKELTEDQKLLIPADVLAKLTNAVSTVDQYGHRLKYICPKPATCTEIGNTEYWTCERCGLAFFDEEAVNLISEQDIVINPLGHIWNEEYTVDKEATYLEEGSESIHCSVCGEIDESTVRSIPKKVPAVDSGTCGENVTWTLTGTDNDLTLTISGSGEIYSFSNNSTPWSSRNGEIKKVIIEDGITVIGDYAFNKMYELRHILIPLSINSIGRYAINTEPLTVYYRGSKEKWNSMVAAINNNLNYESIFYDYSFSVLAIPSFAGMDYVYEGVAFEPPVWLYYNNKELIQNIDYMVSYENNINAGTAKIIIDGIGEYSGSIIKTFRIQQRGIEPQGHNVVINSISTKTYNGRELVPNPIIYVDGRLLARYTDYRVTYENNINVGTATVHIFGKGNYCGYAKTTFTIKKAPNTITAKNFTRTYSTKAQTFELGVKIKNGTPTYTSNSKSVTVSKAGKVTVKAKFIGKAPITITAPEQTNYSKQTKKITITVNPTKTALSSVTSPSAGKMTVKWKKNAVGSGYQIQYSTSSKFTSPKAVSVTKNTTLTKTIGSLAKGKKYYVRIRTYKTVGSAKFYSAWSAAKTVTIKK